MCLWQGILIQLSIEPWPAFASICIWRTHHLQLLRNGWEVTPPAHCTGQGMEAILIWKTFPNSSNLPFWKYFIKSGSSLCGIASGKYLQTNHISNWLDLHTLDCHNRNLKDRWFWEEVACRALVATPQRKMLILKSGDGTISKADGRNLKSRRPQFKQIISHFLRCDLTCHCGRRIPTIAAIKKPRRRSSCNSTNIATITSSLQQTPQRRTDNKR